MPQLQAGLGLDTANRTAEQRQSLSLASGSRRLHSRTRAASYWWDWEGPSSGHGGRRAADPPAAEPRQSSMPSHQQTVLGPKTCAAGNNAGGLSGQGQRSVSTSSRRKAGLRRVRRILHVCQARRAGPWDPTVAGQPGSTATSVQISTTGFMSDRSQALRRARARRATSQLRGTAVVFKLHRAAPTKGCLASTKGCPNGRGGRQPPVIGYNDC